MSRRIPLNTARFGNRSAIYRVLLEIRLLNAFFLGNKAQYINSSQGTLILALHLYNLNLCLILIEFNL